MANYDNLPIGAIYHITLHENHILYIKVFRFKTKLLAVIFWIFPLVKAIEKVRFVVEINSRSRNGWQKVVLFALPSEK